MEKHPQPLGNCLPGWMSWVSLSFWADMGLNVFSRTQTETVLTVRTEQKAVPGASLACRLVLGHIRWFLLWWMPYASCQSTVPPCTLQGVVPNHVPTMLVLCVSPSLLTLPVSPERHGNAQGFFSVLYRGVTSSRLSKDHLEWSCSF